MTQALRKTGRAGATKRHRQAPIDLSRFQPMAPAALITVDDLVRRGAVVIAVRPSLVTLQRGSQTARIDDMGRVDWAH